MRTAVQGRCWTPVKIAPPTAACQDLPPPITDQSRASLLQQPQLPSPQLLRRDWELELTFLVRDAAVTASRTRR